MASAFSICALVVHWRVSIPPGAAEENGLPIPDPKWWVWFLDMFIGGPLRCLNWKSLTDVPNRLIGVNAAQLAIALLSNLFLLLNMARRVSFAIAQPITVIGW
jgi:potassium channel subfamily K